MDKKMADTDSEKKPTDKIENAPVESEEVTDISDDVSPLFGENAINKSDKKTSFLNCFFKVLLKFVLLVLFLALLSLPWWIGYVPAKYRAPVDEVLSSVLPEVAVTGGTEFEKKIALLESRLTHVEAMSHTAGNHDEFKGFSARLTDLEIAFYRFRDDFQAAHIAEHAGGKDMKVAPQTLSVEQKQRLTVLESQLAALGDMDGRLMSRLGVVENKTVQLEDKKLTRSELEPLSSRIMQVEKDLKNKIVEKEQSVMLLMAVTMLRDAIIAGRPFTATFDTLSFLAANDPAVMTAAAPLKPWAEEGVPSLAELKQEFDALAGAAAWEAFKPEQVGWRNRVIGKLMSLVTVRRIDGIQDEKTADAYIKQAEDALKKDDLKTALTALEPLPEAAAKIMAPWQKKADIYLQAESLMGSLMSVAIKTFPAIETEETGKEAEK